MSKDLSSTEESDGRFRSELLLSDGTLFIITVIIIVRNMIVLCSRLYFVYWRPRSIVFLQAWFKFFPVLNQVCCGFVVLLKRPILSHVFKFGVCV